MEYITNFFKKGYKYENVRVPYRSEKLKIDKDEEKTIQKWIKLSLENKDKPEIQYSQSSRVRIIFDTDIGTDIDDALALLMLLHLPEQDYELLGITTVYGYTNVRAEVAKAIVNGYSKDHTIPIIAGESVPLGTHRPIWHTTTEGIGVLDVKKIEELQKIEPSKNREAGKFIVEQIKKYPNQVVLLCLGALSNVASALKIDPKIAPLVKRIVYMGMGHRLKESQTELFEFKGPKETYEPGGVYFHYPNHNISCDTLAAVNVFNSGIPIDVVNDAVTNELWFSGHACEALRKSKTPEECKVVGELLNNWLYYRTSIFFRDVNGTCPHDGITTAEAVYPGKYVNFVRGRLLIHEWAGFSAFVLDPLGNHRIGLSMKDKAEWLDWFGKKLVPGYDQVKQEETKEEKKEEIKEEKEEIKEIKEVKQETKEEKHEVKVEEEVKQEEKVIPAEKEEVDIKEEVKKEEEDKDNM